MADERTYPCLPCADVEEAIAFYRTLGFTQTYRQLKPYAYGVVRREDLHVHLFSMDGFDPAQSYATVIVTVPDPDALYQAFAAGLRAAYGKLPVKGIPRITRPRKRYGTVYGFSVVDVGGNWLRVSKAQASEEEDGEQAPGLAGMLMVATRMGDARGDDALALKTLETGLRRFPDAPALERAQALLYRVELAVRLGRAELARTSLVEAQALAQGHAELASELASASELVSQMDELP